MFSNIYFFILGTKQVKMLIPHFISPFSLRVINNFHANLCCVWKCSSPSLFLFFNLPTVFLKIIIDSLCTVKSQDSFYLLGNHDIRYNTSARIHISWAFCDEKSSVFASVSICLYTTAFSLTFQSRFLLSLFAFAQKYANLTTRKFLFPTHSLCDKRNEREGRKINRSEILERNPLLIFQLISEKLLRFRLKKELLREEIFCR